MGFLSLSLHAQPNMLAHTALIQEILTDNCQILTDSQYVLLCWLFSAHSAHIVQNTYRLQIHTIPTDTYM